MSRIVAYTQLLVNSHPRILQQDSRLCNETVKGTTATLLHKSIFVAILVSMNSIHTTVTASPMGYISAISVHENPLAWKRLSKDGPPSAKKKTVRLANRV